MKRLKYITGLLLIGFVFVLASCEDEIVRDSTHTKVADMVAGTYTGTISFDGTVSFDDVVIVLEKDDDQQIDAVTAAIQSSDFNYNNAAGLDLPNFYDQVDKVMYTKPVYLNTAKANDGYILSCSNPDALRFNGRLENGHLEMTIPILVYGQNTIFHTNAESWQFVGIKN